MAGCYHGEIQFEDPAFGKLKGEEVSKMWEMLLSRKEAQLEISSFDIQADENEGSAKWEANYLYGHSKRRINNKIMARFLFKDGKIIRHVDSFSLWRWSCQALGTIGLLLGWTPFIKGKVQTMARKRLFEYMERTKAS